VLAGGMADRPEDRATLEDLARSLSLLLGESVTEAPPPPARFWTEDQEVTFRENRYRIISKLGSGGMGITFKVVQLDRFTGEEVGTYVAKVAYDAEKGEQMRRAYSLVRSHLGHTGLSTIFEVAGEWRENEFVALMKWVPGTPLLDYAGVFPLLAEDQQELSSQDLALRWLRDSCAALNVLHSNGLIHGDVSPRNLIVAGSELVLTDYDFVQKIGKKRRGLGTLLYSAPSRHPQRPASPSDDIFALAASFFHVLFEREPFDVKDIQEKAKGLNWRGVSSEEYPHLRTFFDKATHPNPAEHFESVNEVLTLLADASERGAAAVSETEVAQKTDVLSPQEQPLEMREEHVPWLRFVLQSYPGSRLFAS
jgi:serine/threonine protein kinase